MKWRDVLSELLDAGAFRTQGGLVVALAERGHPVTQATVSRELTAMGALKVRGVYRHAPPPDLPARVLNVALAYGGGVAVVHTDTAHASVMSQAIDEAQLKGVLGTIAGDDTVLVVMAGPEGWAALRRMLGR
ncbi:MAG: hypothetical protein KC502_16625 [Myxococcales bacterium]|nr:hypothetical protein [Myxococcales bacterium]